MAEWGSVLSRKGFTQICVARGTVSYGSNDAFSMRYTDTSDKFLSQSEVYNLLNETIRRIFLAICFIFICLACSGYGPGV